MEVLNFETLPPEILFKILLKIDNVKDYYTAITTIPVLGLITLGRGNVFERHFRKYIIREDSISFDSPWSIRRDIQENTIKIMYTAGEDEYEENFYFNNNIETIFGKVDPQILLKALRIVYSEQINVLYNEKFDIEYIYVDISCTIYSWWVNEDCYSRMRELIIELKK